MDHPVRAGETIGIQASGDIGEVAEANCLGRALEAGGANAKVSCFLSMVLQPLAQQQQQQQQPAVGAAAPWGWRLHAAARLQRPLLVWVRLRGRELCSHGERQEDPIGADGEALRQEA